MAVAMKDVTVAPSPLWLQCALVAMGSKPINNVVDMTNYIMLMTAQPTHAYDYDTLRGNTLGVRMAEQGEKVTLLNDKTYSLDESDIVIVDGEGVVGLGGVMGGSESEVSDSTKNIVLEVATFDMYTVRKTSMRHGLFTDAVSRFNKGQSPLQNDRVLLRLMELMSEHVGAKQASAVSDLPDQSGKLDQVSLSGEMSVSVDFVNERLGITLSPEDIGGLLRRANFASYPEEGREETLKITAPFWRTDIALPEDIVEEVGRLYGFDKLPRTLPTRSIAPVPTNEKLVLKQRVRTALARAGANEVLTYSFVNKKVLESAKQNITSAFELSNALSPDLHYYRLSVLPSLLDKVHANIKAGHDEFALFEIGKGHNKSLTDEEKLPKELEFIDFVYASKTPRNGSPYYKARRYVEEMARELGVEVKFKPIEHETGSSIESSFALDRSAEVISCDGTAIGIVGEVNQSVARAFKLPQYTAAFTLGVFGLQTAASKPNRGYTPLSQYPHVRQDISLRVSQDTKYGDVYRAARTAVEASNNLTIELSPVAIYQADGADTKTITLRVDVVSSERTLREDEVSDQLLAIERACQEAVNAERA